MAADPSKLSYFSLPGEIRNKIMNLVLVSGDVYPHTPVPNGTKRVPVSAANIQSRSGVQLIATCRQAYDEGHALFYSSNTFHLPATMTFEWSDRLQTKHKCFIKRIGITVGPNELDASVISEIDRTYKNLISQKFDVYPIQKAVSGTLENVWNSKMRRIAVWSSLEEITLCLFKETDTLNIPPRHKYKFQYHKSTLEHWELVANLHNAGFWLSRYWREILWWPQIVARANIAAKADGNTWAATIEWLYERKPGELAEGFWEEVESVSYYMGLGWPWMGLDARP